MKSKLKIHRLSSGSIVFWNKTNFLITSKVNKNDMFNSPTWLGRGFKQEAVFTFLKTFNEKKKIH